MLHISFHHSAAEVERLRPLWESLCSEQQATIFQNFDWNLLAARIFSDREEPLVVCTQASYGAAIVPAVVRRGDHTLHLLGEELFDYRSFLHDGEEDVLRSALAALAQTGHPLEVVAVRECDRRAVMEEMQLTPFTAAPSVNRADNSADMFAARHNRLGRNLRRFQRMDFQLRSYSGDYPGLLRTIYSNKAAQDPGSLFHDRSRVIFLIEAAARQPNRFEIFTLENGARLAAALVTLRDDSYRRFYTCWFDSEFSKLSPAMTLLHEVTRQSLAAGIDCDYMTGEQPYKLRLATSSMPLYRLHATPEQLAAAGQNVQAELRLAG